MQRLTGLDAAFLALETPSTHMHVMATMVLDPSDTPGGFTVDTMRELIAERLPRLEPFRRRVIDIPFGVHTTRCGSRIPTSISTITSAALPFPHREG